MICVLSELTRNPKQRRIQVMENLESHGIIVKVVEGHGKAICFQKIKRQKDKKFEK